MNKAYLGLAALAHLGLAALAHLGLAALLMALIGAPASALMGQDIRLVNHYFCWPKGQTKPQPCSKPELLSRMTAFAQAKKEASPQSVMLYTNGQGQIARELWIAPAMNMWSMEQADKIRTAIMGGQNPSGVSSTGLADVIYAYADGTRVHYAMAHGQVFSILAIGPDFKPGERSQELPRPYEYDKVIRPHP